MRLVRLLLWLYPILLSACRVRISATQIPFPPTLFPTSTVQASIPRTIAVSATAAPVDSCGDWQSWPVVPTVSESTRELYRGGIAGGNDPRAFSKIGDGEISAAWFFTAFDLGNDYYDLGPHRELERVIDHFQGSFGRTGVAARGGFNTRRILDPESAHPSLCQAGESPLTCELRLHRPALAILSLGTNQVWKPEEFDAGMRQILETLLSQNVVPILSTKGDNLEGDHRINRIVACLAQEYDLPLWNFWSAIQPLPGRGLQPDLEHLTYGVTDFDDPAAMQSAWTIRNLTALQALDSVWRGLTAQP